MMDSRFMDRPSLYLEINQDSLQVSRGNEGWELPLERLPNGRITQACKEQAVLRMQAFLKKNLWQPRARAFCGIGAKGVVLRRLTLPPATKEDRERLLVLQIESEFPLPPNELAWGCLPLDGDKSQTESAPAQQSILVVAVRKEVIEEYADLLTECGVAPVFTLAALARSALCPQPPRSYAVLDIGPNVSELASFEDGIPTNVRMLPWGGEDVTRSIQEQLSLGWDEVEKLKAKLVADPTSLDELGQKARNAMDAAFDSLREMVRNCWSGPRLFVSGRDRRKVAASLAKRLGDDVACEALELPAGESQSATIAGLKHYTEKNGAAPPLVLQISQTPGQARPAQAAPWKWAALAIGLALTSLALPYIEALLMQPRLARKLAAVQADKERLALIDRELSFLQHLKQNQPPYLDALFILSKAAPPGARIDALSMNRRGDISLNGFVKDAQQAVDFRAKLVDSGFFSQVAVEEQTPTPDRQKVIVRMSAQWKPASARESLPALKSQEPEKNKLTGKEVPLGAPPAPDIQTPPSSKMPLPRPAIKP